MTSTRVQIRVRGVVQGVGFRPFVYRLATGLRLGGHVGNDADGVLVEVEGRPSSVRAFEQRLIGERPPLARIDAVESTAVAALGEREFRIVASQPFTAGRTFVSPDMAVCDDCLQELFDPSDRRWRYPFINCTNCGPRFTITVRLPYDRPNTTMQAFELCAACATEYHDPGGRRFHAQPIACAACGPRLWFESTHDTVDGSDDAVAAAQYVLVHGGIVSVKGVGGYHLACDARSDDAVATLRARKDRQEKPLAVMVRDLASAARFAMMSEPEAALLNSPQRPVVLLRRREQSLLSPLVAPGNPLVGVLLPYTPVHHLLFAAVPGGAVPAPDVLVMTSGNLSDEPICYDDTDARHRLSRIADAWLCNDRPIHVPCDDSVLRLVDGEELPIRRSRGYAPLPLRLPIESPSVIAVGGELKNAFCLSSGRDAWMSQHIGDMGSVETLAAFERSTRQFSHMYGVRATVAAADAHPRYQTRRWAEDNGSLPVELTQHHHAHIASVMAEHGVAGGEVIGFAFDGTGYGTDGAIWGGEVLIASYDGFARHRHLRYVSLPGGDAAVRKPYRSALAHLRAAGVEWAIDLPPVRDTDPAEIVALERQLDRGVQCVATSSMGRLFDAVSSLLGIRHLASYEAQAAIEMEALAESHLESARVYRFATGATDIDAAPVVRAMVDDYRAGSPVGPIAAGFHIAVARLMGATAADLRERTGLDRVALSGGVFQNVLLLTLARLELVGRGFEVLTHRVVPPNDGGLALGQVVVAAARVSTRSVGR